MSSRVCFLILIAGAAGLASIGCGWGGRRGNVTEYDALPNLSICEVDDVFLIIKRTPDEPDGLSLFVNNQEVTEARLRVGEQFALSNQQDYAEWYRVLLLEPDRITLKRSKVNETIENSGTRKRQRAVEKVVTVKPYNLEKQH